MSGGFHFSRHTGAAKPNQMNTIRTILPLLISWIPILLGGQAAAPDTADRSFRRIDLLPAVSYTPETKLTLGVIGIYYFDLYRHDPATRLSNLQFLTVFTTANQFSARGVWEVFSDGNRWRYRGEAFFDIFPDRNYGRGNGANVLVEEFGEAPPDTLNYLQFNSNRLNVSPVVLRKVTPTLYLGVQGDMEYLYDQRPLSDDFRFLNSDSLRVQELPVEGLRAGIGLQAFWDTRGNVINPLQGAYLEFGTLHFGPWLGSDYNFHSLRLDGRYYWNTWKNQTLALRGVANFRFAGENGIPLRALSRLGGRDFIRGYFKGTYQDHHLLAFEAEYRLPFWPEHTEAPFWKVWKRLGVVGFIGGGQVFPYVGRINSRDFHLAAGAGLRVLFNPESRLNIRIDYALALDPDSGGPGQRQSGFYFFLGEAF